MSCVNDQLQLVPLEGVQLHEHLKRLEERELSIAGFQDIVVGFLYTLFGAQRTPTLVHFEDKDLIDLLPSCMQAQCLDLLS